MTRPTPPPDEPRDAPEPRVEIRRRDGGRLGALLTALGIVTVVALWAITLAGRSWRAPPAALTALVTFLPYMYGLVAAALFAAWSLLPDRRTLPVLLVLLVISGAALWGPSWPARVQEGEGTPLRVMSWNVRRLWGGPDDGGDAARCAVDAIREADPDVLTLLEVSERDVATLERELRLDCVHATYRDSPSDRHGGLAACTRGARWRLRSGQGQRFVDDEDWFYVFTEVEHGGHVVNLFAVHLYPYLYASQRLQSGLDDLRRGETEALRDLGQEGAEVVKGQSDQSAALLARVSRLEDPTLVAGDFNSTRDAALHTALRRTLVDTFEQGGFGFGGTVHFLELAPLRIDYVYASEAFAVRGSHVPEVGCSDHRPVVSDLVLRASPPSASR